MHNKVFNLENIIDSIENYLYEYQSFVFYFGKLSKIFSCK